MVRATSPWAAATAEDQAARWARGSGSCPTMQLSGSAPWRCPLELSCWTFRGRIRGRGRLRSPRAGERLSEGNHRGGLRGRGRAPAAGDPRGAEGAGRAAWAGRARARRLPLVGSPWGSRAAPGLPQIRTCALTHTALQGTGSLRDGLTTKDGGARETAGGTAAQGARSAPRNGRPVGSAGPATSSRWHGLVP